MGDEIALKMANFRLSLTMDRVILHTVMRHSSTSTYIPNFVEVKQKLFVDGRTDGRTEI